MTDNFNEIDFMLLTVSCPITLATDYPTEFIKSVSLTSKQLLKTALDPDI